MKQSYEQIQEQIDQGKVLLIKLDLSKTNDSMMYDKKFRYRLVSKKRAKYYSYTALTNAFKFTFSIITQVREEGGNSCWWVEKHYHGPKIKDMEQYDEEHNILLVSFTEVTSEKVLKFMNTSYGEAVDYV